ncbi:ABC transporter ATP-binding protein [Halobacteriales archaeon SW_7_68_16]|nr:MAG: ABC transporter ATP-binding protein [Halobacteriales archaeon SW_7_68_16]
MAESDADGGGTGPDSGRDAPRDTDDAGTALAGLSPTRTEGTILSVDDLRKTFGGITAVDGASFEVEAGRITGLIGPNGAGKSTTFNCITGFHRPDGGTVTFDGEDVTGQSPESLAERGLARTFQIARELEEMTVLENLMLAPGGQIGERLSRAVLPGFRTRVRNQEERLRERVWETLDLFEIDHLADEYAGSLSGGQRKLLELARALLVDPDLLLLDEPFAGVNPTLEDKLLDRLHDLRAEGLTFLLVEHDMDVIMQNCDRVIVMHQGTVLAEGPPAAIRENDRVIEAYLGGDVA